MMLGRSAPVSLDGS